ncbi:MAG TPA: hypothetical protein PKY82_20405 [Pyrinomonadaceae bacterium]|nr:hypothetical protein [Pyrinomonadaceae bacterium]
MPKISSEKNKNEAGKIISDPKRSRYGFNLKTVTNSPVFNVATLILMLLFVFGGLRFLSASRAPGQVKFIERPNSAANEQSSNKPDRIAAPEIFRGEIYDTSIRLREAGALGMAISLAVFTTGAEQSTVPLSLENIWDEIENKKLMPPGLEMKNGELRSPFAKIIVRYQAHPLRFEILSFPLSNTKSPALLIRFPLNRLDGRTITYFQSKTAETQNSPPPFASFEKIVSVGWTLEQWRGELLPKPENTNQMIEEEKRFLDQMKK